MCEAVEVVTQPGAAAAQAPARGARMAGPAARMGCGPRTTCSSSGCRASPSKMRPPTSSTCSRPDTAVEWRTPEGALQRRWLLHVFKVGLDPA
jgi:hypothetical protein